ncbi:hypothetical protein DFH06DRAFT_1439314 [Mycena polygramma]|nr:hypothetical protein DFH06DRAFT_1439314 [Mycena polygramma]
MIGGGQFNRWTVVDIPKTPFLGWGKFEPDNLEIRSDAAESNVESDGDKRYVTVGEAVHLPITGQNGKSRRLNKSLSLGSVAHPRPIHTRFEEPTHTSPVLKCPQMSAPQSKTQFLPPLQLFAELRARPMQGALDFLFAALACPLFEIRCYAKINIFEKNLIRALSSANSCNSPTYHPARLPPLDEPHWAIFAGEPVELLEGLKQKKTRKGYSKLGRLALEHCVVIMLGESVFDELDGYVKTIQRQVLSEEVLTAILNKLDARLLGKRASYSGFVQFVGALWVRHNYNTGEVAALLWPTLDPLVEIAGTTYTELKGYAFLSVIYSLRIDEPSGPSRRAGTASDGKRVPKISDDLQFLMNAREIQESYVSPPSGVVSPTHSASSNSDESMDSPSSNVDRTASSPYQFRVESPSVSPGTFESKAGASERSSSHPPLMDFNKILPPATLRTPITMDDDEARRSREFFEYSPEQASSSYATDVHSLSPHAFRLPANLALTRNPEEGDTVLREIIAHIQPFTQIENISPPSGGLAPLLGPAFVPVVKKTQYNATASSSKITLDSGSGSTAVVKSPGRSPFTPNNGRSSSTGISRRNLHVIYLIPVIGCDPDVILPRMSQQGASKKYFNVEEIAINSLSKLIPCV